MELICISKRHIQILSRYLFHRLFHTSLLKSDATASAEQRLTPNGEVNTNNTIENQERAREDIKKRFKTLVKVWTVNILIAIVEVLSLLHFALSIDTLQNY